MTTRVLAATDLSDASDEALRQAYAYAQAAGAELAVCHVVTFDSPVDALFPQKYQAAALEMAELEVKIKNAVEARVRAVTGSSPAHVFVEQGTDYAEIVRRAESWGATLIVVGSHGRTGIPRLLLGSVAERVVRYALSPVLVARSSPARGHVLVATDLSDPSLPAIPAGAAEARRRGARLTVMHAMDYAGTAFTAIATTPFGITPYLPNLELQKELEQVITSRLRDALTANNAQGDVLVKDGMAAAAIVATADELGAELVVIGTHGRTGLSRLALGSVAERVIRSVACSVLAVRVTSI